MSTKGNVRDSQEGIAVLKALAFVLIVTTGGYVNGIREIDFSTLEACKTVQAAFAANASARYQVIGCFPR
jgi:hypothetical protein